jgi:hypothetical protein
MSATAIAIADTKLRPDQIASDICQLLRRFHRESCYPDALPFEVEETVNDILFLMQRVNWTVVISARDANL